jgi:rhodanese-related sulfurtransferase
VKTLWSEAVLVVVVGAVIGFAANALSPRGLNLSRDYFPDALASTNTTVHPPGTNVMDAAEANPLAARLAAQGLNLATHADVTQVFSDPKYQQGLFIIIDARKDEVYREGHIPGACQLDYYRPENHLPSVLPAAQIAEEIIVYCKGGQCEDSEFIARLLASAGIPASKIFVYGEGFDEWANRGMPIETGEKGSGLIRGGTAR